jgi:hypothetical protein
VHRFLTAAVGLHLAPGNRLTGGTYRHYIAVPVGPPAAVDFGLPSGYPAPTFERGVLVSDRHTGTLTYFASSTSGLGASLTIVITRASTTTLDSAADLTGAFEIPQLPVLGGHVGLKGSVKYAAGGVQVSATSYDTAATRLDGGRVSVSPDLRVTLGSGRGLSVAGRATLGTGRESLRVALSGSLAATDGWSLRLTTENGAAPWQPVDGLVVDPSFSGTLTNRAGAVRFDVASSRPVIWAPTPVTSETAARLVYSDDTPPAGTAVPVGYRAGDAWIGTTGRFDVSAGAAGTLHATGQLAVDLTSGRATVRAGAGSVAGLNASVLVHRKPVDGATLSGALALDGSHLVGTLAIATPRNGSLRISGASLAGALTAPAAARAPAAPATNGPAAPGAPAASALSASSTTYTISAAVYTFLSQTLGLSVSSPTLSGALSGSTLTVKLGAPTRVLLPLPSGSVGLKFRTTRLIVNETTNTLTVRSSASAGGATATLSATVKNAGTTTTSARARLTITGLSVLGVGVSLTGTLRARGSGLTFSLTGTTGTAATLTSGVVLESGATVSVASGKGLSVNGTLDLGSGATLVPVTVAGTLAGVSNWTLQVSDSNAPSWQPEPGLTITPNFKGSLTDKAGKITFDLSSANTASWDPAPNTALDLSSIEISNDTPPSGVSCPSGLADGSVWVDVQGTVTYTPPGAPTPLVTLSAEACLAPAAESFVLTTSATGNLVPPLGSTFTLTGVALDVTGNFSTDTFSVDGSASLGGVGSSPALTVGLSFDTDGSFVAGVTVPDLSQLGLSGLSGSGALWVSTKDDPNFVPSTIPGFSSTAPFHLREGLDATFTYSLDPTEVSQLRSWGIPVPQSATAVASISTSGISVNIDLDFGAGESGQTIFSTGGAAVYLNTITLGVTLSSDPVLSLSGTATLHLPSVTGNSSSVPSDVSITLTASFALDSLDINVGLSLTGQCGATTCPWQNAFGIQGLTVGTFAANIGVEFGSGIPTPTLAFSLDNVILPTDIAQPIGLQPDAEISIDVSFDLENPVVHFGLTAPTGQAALYPLEILGPSSGIQDAIIVDTADFWLAPTGGQLATGQQISPGASVKFVATFAGVNVTVYAAVSLSTLSVDALIQISNFQLGPVTFSAGPNQPAVLFKLHIGTDGFSFQFEGGFSFVGFDFSASIDLSAVSSFVGASASLNITAGLPQYLQLGANLHGSFSINSSGIDLSASGSGYLIVAGTNLGSVSFSFSFDSGAAWAAITAAAQQVAQAFENAYGWVSSQVTQALAGLEYDATEVANALDYIGVQAAQIGQDIATFFTGTTDGSLAYYLQQAGLTPDQIAGALQSAFNDVDSTVAYWLNQVGYGADQIAGALASVFADPDSTVAYWLNWLGDGADQIGGALQSVFGDADSAVAYWLNWLGYGSGQIAQTLMDVYNDAEYQILDAFGQIGITGQSVINDIASFFTGAGSYWLSTSDPWNLDVPLYLDVTGGSTQPGTQVIQWTWNGGYNQDWFVVPTDSGYAEIVNRNSGQCLTVAGDSNQAGTSLVQWPCTGDYSQQWYIGNGTYPGWSEANWTAGIGSRLNPGQNVDVQGASGSAGAWIDQWYWNGDWNQTWHFTQAVG